MVDIETPRSPVTVGGERGSVWTLVVGCLGVALVVGSMVAFNTALGEIAIATSATQTQLNWIVDGYTVVLACLLLPAGAIGDRYGRRVTMLAGLAVFTLASATPAIVDSPGPIIAARMLAGAGAAFVMPATLSMLSRVYPSGQRAKAIGVWASVAGSAGVLGLLGSGVLLQYWEWEAICWALAACGVLVLSAASTITQPADADAPAVDWWGAVLIAAAVASLTVGLLEAPVRGWMHSSTLACLAGGVLAGALFVIVEARQQHPLLDPKLFRSPAVATSAVAITAVFAATFGFFYLGMQYVQLVLGYSALGAAVAFAPFAVPVVALSLLSVRFAPRWGLTKVLIAGMAVTSLGFLCMLSVDAGSSPMRLFGATVIIGAGIGLSTAPATTSIMLSLGDDRQGVASAINDTTRELGAAVGIAVAGSVLAERYTTEVSPALSALPPSLREQVADGFGKAARILDAMGPQVTLVVDASQRAFMSAVHSSALVIALLTAAAGAVIALIAHRGTASSEQPID